ncbi:hypothetical protein HYV43_04745 [Candidatus Micrarchaeota archaeon]|nr:hypothetical protein [Candidatus Micrarchaeota archaeon]
MAMSRMLVVLAIVFLLAATGAYMYTETKTGGGFFSNETTTSAPFQVYAFPMLVGGVVLAAVGLVRNH